MESQCWICPKCNDDHNPGMPCSTPGPVERKFATVLSASMLEIGGERFPVVSLAYGAATEKAEKISAAHESAIAEAVKEEVQKTIEGMQAIEDMRRAEAVKAAVSETFDAVIEFLRTEGLDECGRMIRVQRDVLFKKIAQGATHG